MNDLTFVFIFDAVKFDEIFRDNRDKNNAEVPGNVMTHIVMTLQLTFLKYLIFANCTPPIIEIHDQGEGKCVA